MRAIAFFAVFLASACRDPAPAADPATTPGPSSACAVDDDCAPSSPCGLTAEGLCLDRSAMARNASVECAHPVPSTHRCACLERRCAVVPIAR